MKRLVVAFFSVIVLACTSNPPISPPPDSFAHPSESSAPANSAPTIQTAQPVATETDAPTLLQTSKPTDGSIASPLGSERLVEVLVGGGTQPVTERAGVTDVLLKQPSGIDVGSVGDSTVQGSGNIYITDSGLGIEFRVWPAGQVLDVLRGMEAPEGLTITGEGMGPGYPVVADAGNNTILVPQVPGHTVTIPPPPSNVTSFAGDPSNPGFGGDGGPPEKASLLAPHDVTTGPGANCSFYIADTGNNRIRTVEPGRTCESDWTINTVVGDGRAGFRGDGFQGSVAELNGPEAVLIGGDGLLIADTGNHRIRTIGLGGGDINTIIGNGEANPVAYDPKLGPLEIPIGSIASMAVDQIGGIYFPVLWSDIGLTIMRLDPYGNVQRVAGGGTSATPGVDALDFELPDVLSLAVDQYDSALLIGCADGKVYRVPGIGP